MRNLSSARSQSHQQEMKVNNAQSEIHPQLLGAHEPFARLAVPEHRASLSARALEHLDEERGTNGCNGIVGQVPGIRKPKERWDTHNIVRFLNLVKTPRGNAEITLYCNCLPLERDEQSPYRLCSCWLQSPQNFDRSEGIALILLRPRSLPLLKPWLLTVFGGT